MRTELLNDGWGFRPVTSPFLEAFGHSVPPQPVTLPHDALISVSRSADNHPGALTGFHGEGLLEYVRTLRCTAEDLAERIEIEFDGVYRDAMVYVNDSFVAQRPAGYSPFSTRIDAHLSEGENTIRVECRNHADARWYSGLGIYRDVRILRGGAVHVSRNGLRIRTVSASKTSATLATQTTLQNNGTRLRKATVFTEILAPSGEIAAAEHATVTVRPQEAAVLRQRFAVDAPQRWSPESPALYSCRTRVEFEGTVVDEHVEAFGIRTLDWNARQGLLLNGEPIKLRGGCVHHDNGVLGAATFARAEERRVEILKGAGYNAIRSAHNPLSRAMIEACDRLGMLVLDEFTDGWMSPTLGFGYGLALNEWWRRDLAELVGRDYNHPSVIMYSIGNEVTDTGHDWGATFGRDLAELLRALDDTRPVTNAINPLMTSLRDVKTLMGRDDESGVNALMRDVQEFTGELVRSDLASARLEESTSQLDVTGYNYAFERYDMDIERHPQRLFLGTESIPAKLDRIWPLVQTHDAVIGDFAWTAWEYAGEAGLGIDKPAAEGFFGSYPTRLSGTGDIGITGRRRTVSYWREIIWGLRTAPFIAVHRPDAVTHPDAVPALYTWPESTDSWTWPGFEGRSLTVDVYSDAEEIELLLDGVPLARRSVGDPKACIARFEVDYRPGKIEAVAYRRGKPIDSTSLSSADELDVRLRAAADRSELRSDGQDLAFIDIALQDSAGRVSPAATADISVHVEGPGVLQGLGSDAFASENSYAADRCETFLGRALAVVRPTGAGTILVRIATDDGEHAELSLRAG
jgi:hypothetical protein